MGKSSDSPRTPTAVEFTDADCEKPDTASIETDPDAGTVTVTGCISGANACYEAELADVEASEDDDMLRVVIRSYDASKPGQMCAQVIVNLGYRVDLSFDDGPMPGRIEVHHQQRGRAETVASTAVE